MKCDIIIPVWNQLGYTKQCLAAIIKYTQYPFRVIIIDNGSDTKTKEYLENLKQDKKIDSILIQNEENLGWVKAVNQGLKMSDAPYACIMNNDTEVTESWLSKMVEVTEKEPDIGLVNPSWEKPKGVSIQSYAKFLNKYNGEYIEVDWCRGFCILIKRDVIKRVGFLDEIYGLGYYDDRDYSVRVIKAGFICVKALGAFVYHHRNVTANKRLEEQEWQKLYDKNKRTFYKRWGKPLRLVFVLDKIFLQNDISEQLKDLWLSLLRDQHLIYIWSRKAPAYPAHINIHFKSLPFNWLIYFRIWDNCRRNIGKRYDAIFLGAEKLAKFILDRFGTKITIFCEEKKANITQDIKSKMDILKKQYQPGEEV